jgi:hypothetical protein
MYLCPRIVSNAWMPMGNFSSGHWLERSSMADTPLIVGRQYHTTK